MPRAAQVRGPPAVGRVCQRRPARSGRGALEQSAVGAGQAGEREHGHGEGDDDVVRDGRPPVALTQSLEAISHNPLTAHSQPNGAQRRGAVRRSARARASAAPAAGHVVPDRIPRAVTQHERRQDEPDTSEQDEPACDENGGAQVACRCPGVAVVGQVLDRQVLQQIGRRLGVRARTVIRDSCCWVRRRPSPPRVTTSSARNPTLGICRHSLGSVAIAAAIRR